MFESFKSDKYSWMLIAGLFLIVIQTLFDGWGFLFPTVLFGAMIYYGRKKRPSGTGKVLFWIGIVGITLTVLNLIIFKLAILGLFIFLLVEFIRAKRHPRRLTPNFGDQQTIDEDSIVSLPVILKNKWFGNQETPGQDYEWQDINIQTGTGDTLIDLSHTILPKKESVILIRHLAGRVRILVPYGVEASLRYSVVFGQTEFFEHKESRLFNTSVAFRTGGYETAEQKVCIVVSAVAGNLEVRRV